MELTLTDAYYIYESLKKASELHDNVSGTLTVVKANGDYLGFIMKNENDKWIFRGQ